MIRRALARILEGIAWVLFVCTLVVLWAYQALTGHQLWEEA